MLFFSYKKNVQQNNMKLVIITFIDCLSQKFQTKFINLSLNPIILIFIFYKNLI